MPRCLSEFDLIAQLFAPLAGEGAFRLTDDAAIVPAREGQDLVVTKDALVEGVHFLADDPPATIAGKALRVNLSDLAAKGAVPAGYLLALSLPARIDREWMEAFAGGLKADQHRFAIALLGGDTTATPGPLTLSITAFGYVPQGQMIRRSGARAGDGVYVSGTIGDAGGGLDILQAKAACAQSDLVSRYRHPVPRLALGLALRGVASAALDVSDGLIADVAHICETSGVGIAIEAARIPLSPALKALWGDGEEAILRAVTCGDDYEIAFTAAEEAAVWRAAERARTPVTRIGTVRAGKGVVLSGEKGEIAVTYPGFTHF